MPVECGPSLQQNTFIMTVTVLMDSLTRILIYDNKNLYIIQKCYGKSYKLNKIGDGNKIGNYNMPFEACKRWQNFIAGIWFCVLNCVIIDL